jgi:hypothetical protein
VSAVVPGAASASVVDSAMPFAATWSRYTRPLYWSVSFGESSRTFSCTRSRTTCHEGSTCAFGIRIAVHAFAGSNVHPPYATCPSSCSMTSLPTTRLELASTYPHATISCGTELSVRGVAKALEVEPMFVLVTPARSTESDAPPEGCGCPLPWCHCCVARSTVVLALSATQPSAPARASSQLSSTL